MAGQLGPLPVVAEAFRSGRLSAVQAVEMAPEVQKQLAYVQIALPAELPRPETIDALGQMTGESW
jgi:hypothetical protein